jgi:hypothetical protein
VNPVDGVIDEARKTIAALHVYEAELPHIMRLADDDRLIEIAEADWHALQAYRKLQPKAVLAYRTLEAYGVSA